MCGISGYLDLDNGVSTQILRRMNDVIRHRGPDDEGYALFGPEAPASYGGPDSDRSLGLRPLEQADGGQAFLGLGHRRLSILDLTPGGHQPMLDHAAGLALVYNGEIYNYIELRAELAALGHKFTTTCDTEVLLAAYRQWGEDCLEHMNGMWSFALWDSRSGTLFCARDRLGAKPFHYYHKGGRFLFGSELKQLCQDPQIPRRFCRPYLAANLMYRLSDYSDQTLIEDFYQLRPGHKLTLTLSSDRRSIASFQISRYWELNAAPEEGVPEEEWRRRVAEEFARSCRWRLRSDAPVGALLSGGLDSSCLVTELCAQMEDPSRLQTFTTSYPGHSDCDEWHFANLVNQACGCRGNQVLPDPTDGIERRFERVVWHAEGMVNLSLLGVQMLLDEIHRQGLKVILNGQCGDETMFGYEQYYAFYFAGLLKQGRLGRLVREFRATARHSALSAGRLAQLFTYFSVPAVRDGRQLHRAGSFVNREVLDDRNREELHRLLYPRSMDELLKLELTATNLPLIVRHDDRFYMASSLESRIPFMDYQFVELAARIPASLKIQDGYTKSIMRRVFDSRMPREITWRTDKKGFPAPQRAWAAAFSQDYLLDQVHTARTAAYFQTDVLERIARTDPASEYLTSFLWTEQFARQFGVC